MIKKLFLRPSFVVVLFFRFQKFHSSVGNPLITVLGDRCYQHDSLKINVHFNVNSFRFCFFLIHLQLVASKQGELREIRVVRAGDASNVFSLLLLWSTLMDFSKGGGERSLL
jgi:hypothetical protein